MRARRCRVLRTLPAAVAGAVLAAALPFACARGADPLFDRIAAHAGQELTRLTDCTCLETLERERREPGPSRPLKPLDTVRFEVLFSNGRELYASAGTKRWEEDPAAFPAAGLVGSGPFALYLRAIFSAPEGTFTNRGTDSLSGRPALRYDFAIPRFSSGFNISVPGGSGIVGMKGSFWVEPESLDLLRLEIAASEIPPELPIVSFEAEVRYAATRVGERELMLPQNGQMRMVKPFGEENRAGFSFTQCRSFRAESALRFEAVPTAETEAAFSSTVTGHPKAEKILPPGLELAVRLSIPVTEQLAVGTAIEGRVSKDVRFRGAVLVPRDAVARGRVRRMDRFTDESGGYLVVALEFVEIETPDAELRFLAGLTSVERVAGLDLLWRTRHVASEQDQRRKVTTTYESSLPYVPGVGAFFVRGSRFTLPAGTAMRWRTLSAAEP